MFPCKKIEDVIYRVLACTVHINVTESNEYKISLLYSRIKY